mmetsp:Transcript_4745/g.10481  ORF Transcript_4745/g.10481 Transcript_4745/m.10481 type:complete len:82 (-) Transcript_4745:9-254(-)
MQFWRDSLKEHLQEQNAKHIQFFFEQQLNNGFIVNHSVHQSSMNSGRYEESNVCVKNTCMLYNKAGILVYVYKIFICSSNN